MLLQPGLENREWQNCLRNQRCSVSRQHFPDIANISALVDNERKIGQLVAPWVLVENVKIIGK